MSRDSRARKAAQRQERVATSEQQQPQHIRITQSRRTENEAGSKLSPQRSPVARSGGSEPYSQSSQWIRPNSQLRFGVQSNISAMLLKSSKNSNHIQQSPTHREPVLDWSVLEEQQPKQYSKREVTVEPSVKWKPKSWDVFTEAFQALRRNKPPRLVGPPREIDKKHDEKNLELRYILSKVRLAQLRKQKQEIKGKLEGLQMKRLQAFTEQPRLPQLNQRNIQSNFDPIAESERIDLKTATIKKLQQTLREAVERKRQLLTKIALEEQQNSLSIQSQLNDSPGNKAARDQIEKLKQQRTQLSQQLYRASQILPVNSPHVVNHPGISRLSHSTVSSDTEEALRSTITNPKHLNNSWHNKLTLLAILALFAILVMHRYL